MAALPRRSKIRAVAAATLGLAVWLPLPLPTSPAAATPLADPGVLLAIKSPALLRVKSYCKWDCPSYAWYERCFDFGNWQNGSSYVPPGPPPPECFGPNGELLNKSVCWNADQGVVVKEVKVCNYPPSTHPPYKLKRPRKVWPRRLTPNAARDGLLNRNPVLAPSGPGPIGTPRAPPPAGVR